MMRASRVFQVMIKKPNIILIVLDSVRYDHTSCLHYGRNTTPNLASIKDAIYFQNAISPAPWSPPAYASIFTGLYPTQHGVHLDHERGYRGLILSSPTFVDRLRDLGYTTVAFSNNKLISKALGFGRGFKEFYEEPGATAEKTFDQKGSGMGTILKKSIRMFRRWKNYHISPYFYGAVEKGSRRTNQHINSWLEKEKKPFFMFISYMEVHEWSAGLSHIRGLDRDIKDRVTQLLSDRVRTLAEGHTIDSSLIKVVYEVYDSALSYIDYRLGQLFRILESKGAFDNTAIIITSDHGEMLGEKNYFGHGCSFLHNALLQVPLVIKEPNSFSADNMSVDKVFSTKNIYHIVNKISQRESCLEFIKKAQDWCGAESFGVADQFGDKIRMRNPKLHNRLNTQRRTLISGNYKLVYNYGDKSYVLYNLSNDKNELRDISEEDKERVQEMLLLFNRWISELRYIHTYRERIKRKIACMRALMKRLRAREI